MNRAALKLKQQKLQAKLRVKEKYDRLIDYLLPYYEELRASDVKFEIEYLVYCPQADKEYREELLEGGKWSSFGITGDHTRTHGENLHDKLFERFPSTLSLRYRPNIEVIQSFGEVLEEDKMNNVRKAFNDKVAFLLHTNFSPVIKLLDTASALPRLPFLPLEDTVIFTPDLNIVLFRSMEDEWMFQAE